MATRIVSKISWDGKVQDRLWQSVTHSHFQSATTWYLWNCKLLSSLCDTIILHVQSIVGKKRRDHGSESFESTRTSYSDHSESGNACWLSFDGEPWSVFRSKQSNKRTTRKSRRRVTSSVNCSAWALFITCNVCLQSVILFSNIRRKIWRVGFGKWEGIVAWFLFLSCLWKRKISITHEYWWLVWKLRSLSFTKIEYLNIACYFILFLVLVSHTIFLKKQPFVEFICEIMLYSPSGKREYGGRRNVSKISGDDALRYLDTRSRTYQADADFLLKHCKSKHLRLSKRVYFCCQSM